MQYLSGWQVDNAVGKIKPVIERKCKEQKGTACTHRNAILDKLFDGSYGYKPCDCVCCDKCDNLASCKTACPLLSEKVKRLRADRRAQNAQEKAAKDQPVIDEISEFWRREAAARAASGKSVKDLFAATESYYSQANEQSWVENETLQKIRTDTLLPFGLHGFYLGEAHRLISTAKCLGVTTDYLLGLSDELNGAETSDLDDAKHVEPPAEGWVPLQFVSGMERPPRDGMYYCRFDCEGHIVTQPAWWDGLLQKWSFRKYGDSIDTKCVSWFPLPNDKEVDYA